MNQSYKVLTEALDAVSQQARLETDPELKLIIEDAEKDLEASVQWMQSFTLHDPPSK